MIESLPVSNIGYSGGDTVWVLSPDGEVEIREIGRDIPYPYFYAKNDLSKENVVVEVDKQKIRILEMNSIDEVDMEKTSVFRPSMVHGLRSLAGRCAENDVQYLERRLGADGILNWLKPSNVAYIDIENDRKTGKVTLIGAIPLMDNGKVVGNYESFREEKPFYDWIEAGKIGSVLAWNGANYDYRFLKGEGNDYWSRVLKMDAMDLYSDAFHRPSRGLDFVARVEGIGKKLDESVVGLEKYNENDCRIMMEIVEKYSLLDVKFALSALTGVAPWNLRQIAMFENYIMKNREKYGIWLKGSGIIPRKEKYQGALNLGNSMGLHEGVADFDFKGLYPSVVMFEDFLGTGRMVWKTLQKVMSDFVTLKDYAGKMKASTGEAKYFVLREAYKVLANGSYGTLGTPFFRYYSRDAGEFVASKARDKLMEARKIIEELGIEIIYSDSVAKGTPLLVRNDGIIDVIKIEDAKEGFETVSENGWVKIERVIEKKSKKRHYSIETMEGVVEVTEDHSLLDEEYKEISPSQVEVGNKLGSIDYDNIEWNNSMEMTKDEAWLLGYFVADGCAKEWKNCKKNSAHFDGQKLEPLKRARRILQSIGFESKICAYKSCITAGGMVYRLNILKPKVGGAIDYFSQCYDRDSKRKKIPFRVFNSSLEAVEAFVSGYLVGDGSNKNKEGIWSATDVPEVVFGLQMLSKKIGAKCRYQSYGGQSGRRLYLRQWRVVRNPTDGRLIGDFVVRKKTDLGIKEEVVYDLETSNHHFMAGGILLHNTDSVFVLADEDKARRVLEVINRKLFPYSAKTEYYFSRLLFSGTEEKMVKKRYAGLTSEGEMVVRGFEAIRSDWSLWARTFQTKLFDMILKESKDGLEERIAEYVLNEKKTVLSGKMDPEMVGITKSVDVERLKAGKYKAKPQACRAYEMMKNQGEGVISFATYWIGKKGELLTVETDDLQNKIDWKSVWVKQGEAILKRLEGIVKIKGDEEMTKTVLEMWASKEN